MVSRKNYSLVNYYELLQVPRTANTEEIRLAYRKQLLRWHPDKNANSPTAEEMTKTIAEGYHILLKSLSLSETSHSTLRSIVLLKGTARQSNRSRRFSGIVRLYPHTLIFLTRKRERGMQVAKSSFLFLRSRMVTCLLTVMCSRR